MKELTYKAKNVENHFSVQGKFLQNKTLLQIVEGERTNAL